MEGETRPQYSVLTVSWALHTHTLKNTHTHTCTKFLSPIPLPIASFFYFINTNIYYCTYIRIYSFACLPIAFNSTLTHSLLSSPPLWPFICDPLTLSSTLFRKPTTKIQRFFPIFVRWQVELASTCHNLGKRQIFGEMNCVMFLYDSNLKQNLPPRDLPHALPLST